MTWSLTLNFNDLVVDFDSEEEWEDYKRKERAATDKQLTEFWAAPNTRTRKWKRRMLSDARVKFAKDRGLRVRKVRT